MCLRYKDLIGILGNSKVRPGAGHACEASMVKTEPTILRTSISQYNLLHTSLTRYNVYADFCKTTAFYFPSAITCCVHFAVFTICYCRFTDPAKSLPNLRSTRTAGCRPECQSLLGRCKDISKSWKLQRKLGVSPEGIGTCDETEVPR